MRNLIKYLILLSLLLNSGISSSQIYKVKNKYKGGKIKEQGQYTKYNTSNKTLYCKCCVEIKKKSGRWNYYYPNGILQQSESYKLIQDCNQLNMPDGKWEYWNEDGSILKTEIYKDGILFDADIADIYKNDELIGRIRIKEAKRDTIYFKDFESGNTNLVQNASFELYKGKPRLLYQNGQQQIEANIPYWYTPNKSTPDYYNQYRKLLRVPDNFIFNKTDSAEHNYVGIILFHEPTPSYSEYITGELKIRLKKNIKYLLKIRIRLSQLSGDAIENIGVYLSGSIPVIPNTMDAQTQIPQITFHNNINNRDQWTILCDSFIASGDERYITVGRFSSCAETNIKRIFPLNISQGQFNQSAYYLIDNIDLCEEKTPYPSYFQSIRTTDTLALRIGQTFILQNIYFEFDKTTLLPSSTAELNKLKAFLEANNHISICIMGHTDNTGNQVYNEKLSYDRASAVSHWLTDNGINGERIQIKGYGSHLPLFENSTDENRAKNRRVEFKITGL